jgi:Bacterial PH domain/Short C-terminal domain
VSFQKHLQPDEQVLYRAYPSRVPLVPPSALAAAGVIGLLVARAKFAPDWTLILCGLVAAVGLVLALAKYVALSANQYVLTDRRLLRVSGILGRSSMDSYLDKINNVEHRQTVWGRILGYGDVEIDTASETGAEVFPRIANPLEFKRAVDAAASAYRIGVRGRPLPPAAAAASGAGTAAAGAAATGAEKIRQLKQLLDDGLISQAEFEAKRKQLLDQI